MRRLGVLLQRFWRDEAGGLRVPLVVLTLPAGILFGTAARVRNLLYDHGVLPTRRASIPVVSVGNLAVGGTGKTPVAAWLVSLLAEEGFRPALVARGYGEDELHLHRRWNPQVPVVRAPRRLAGIEEAAEMGCDVAVLDDGFQHRAVARDVDLVLLSPAHPLPPRLLPRGPFRESLRALRRADALLVTRKGRAEEEGAKELLRELEALPGTRPVHPMPLMPGDWLDLAGSPAEAPDGPLLAVASVAEPRGFAELVRERTGRAPELATFPDHHAYSEGDVARIVDRAGGRTVVTTEKDAVKLAPFGRLLAGTRVLPLRVRPSSAVRASLRALLGDRIRRRVPAKEAG